MVDVKIIPQTTNTFKIKVGNIELDVYCSDGEYISIKSNGKIEYPEVLMRKHLRKDRVRFFSPESKE